MNRSPVIVSTDFLVEHYDAIVFDSYGVLVDGIDPLPGAVEFTGRLSELRKPWLLATNDASRLTDHRVEAMREQGFEITADQVISAGSLLGRYFQERGIVGTQCIATGYGDAVEFVRLAGCTPVPLTSHDGVATSLALAGVTGYDWAEATTRVLSLIIRRMDAGTPLHLVVPNPDVLYPDGADRFSIGPGGLAEMLEAAASRCFGDDEAVKFTRLGKPYAPMFDAIKARLGRYGKVVFVGDQLHTDIAGANRAGLDSVLIGTGITRWEDARDLNDVPSAMMPKYLLPSMISKA
jgi:HAD superfamily hydrolase (TIGR01450 family)